ncbi:ATP-binding protein [Phormidium sp. LEGE 05292]|uniref:P-loop NTPase fold protein n=1 Tax=[Phormidium] sp. LEGE 05292 TaxID=767427 RepID=UPI001882125E|nr:P-loop NTPase fold protein [Phormidium sp. LEGE 05292]MBE9228198.1 ATP-binding protein [Phormidium sp. LEGE 05292]
MASIDDIIKREVNPFDPTTFKQGHFWREKQVSAFKVDSIHQEALLELEGIVDTITNDHCSRTVMLAGDSGSGKTYFLGRLKSDLNDKAFFAYISPWPDSDGIWRHILRYTVDSLMCVPEGQEESQLMLWLKSLSAFTKRSLKQRIFDDNVWDLLRSDRQNFIKHFKQTYREAGIYNADSFFGVLHDLIDPELYPLACEWLRGEDLSDESLQVLKVKRSIETEEAACEILSNFGRISTETQPIVLCFDQLEAISRLPDGTLDLQALFSVNSKIQNEKWNNFLIIISITTDIWRQNSNRIHQSDKAGIYKVILLKRISLEQAEALWGFRLYPIHIQANPRPNSPILPLTKKDLEQKFPGGKTDPRNVLDLGRRLFQTYKEKIIDSSKPSLEIDLLAAFQLLWQDEFKKIQGRINKITLLSAPELIQMLAQSLNALQVSAVRMKLLTGHFASYSLSYEAPNQRRKVGVIWTEDSNLRSFFNVMNACQKAIDTNVEKNFYLIRAADVGNKQLAGNKIYSSIFTGSQHFHIKPNLSSIHYMATYHSLLNSALANELVIAGQTINRQNLEALIRESNVLHECQVLQDLGIVNKRQLINEKTDDLKEVKEFLLNLIKTQGLIGKDVLIQNTLIQFPQINYQRGDHLIQQLLWERKVKIVNPNDRPPNHLVCFVPKI